MNCYSPTDSADEHKLGAFYYQLEEIIRSVKPYYKFVDGDFNARLEMANESEYSFGIFGSGERNENGTRPAGLLSATRLFH
ncbi:hypothetical protein KIN20_038224 [Parelaphostrongylus tenuis]|uniref:Endonuclease/exonuclease/phosphatase domain-containing protein n=1 Tax=Parelaphostrongylus tenuis TaxID=148309 RepID=A0AAD5REU5_PARTN|nr:hypothetical protein KIN20_038224 [Parelaphostrongylus tenuis]